jgi:integrase
VVKGKGLMSLEPKTDRSRRQVSLAPDALALLAGLKAKQREERELSSVEWSESSFVFSHPDGTPFYPNTVSKKFSELVKKAGVPRLRLHDLRHTHATLMLKEGVNPKIVSERLGHASVVITLDTYSHVLPGLQEEAALKFEEGLKRSMLVGQEKVV